MDYNFCKTNIQFCELLKINILPKDILKYIIYPYINYTPFGIGIELYLESKLKVYEETKNNCRYISNRKLDKNTGGIIITTDPYYNPACVNHISLIGHSVNNNEMNIIKSGYSRRGYFTMLNNEEINKFKNNCKQKYEDRINGIENINILQKVLLYNNDECIIYYIDQLTSLDKKLFYILYEDQIENASMQIQIIAKINFKENNKNTVDEILFETEHINIIPIFYL